MKTVQQYMEELTEEEIEKAYHEHDDWRKTGVLNDGVLRDIYEKLEKENDGHYFPLHAIIEPLLYEMVKRYRKRLNK